MNSSSSNSRKSAYAKRPCWRERGLTEPGAKVADAALAAMVRLAEKVHPDILRIVFDEAVFRARELPKRTPAFREAYFKKNGVTTKCDCGFAHSTEEDVTK